MKKINMRADHHPASQIVGQISRYRGFERQISKYKILYKYQRTTPFSHFQHKILATKHPLKRMKILTGT